MYERLYHGLMVWFQSLCAELYFDPEYITRTDSSNESHGGHRATVWAEESTIQILTWAWHFISAFVCWDYSDV